MEKKGYTEKLEYNFNTAYSTEVEINGNFYRTTCNEFRSWGGNRRILNVKDRTNPVYEEYLGPVYYFGSNKIVPKNKMIDQINYLPGYVRPERTKR
jgi:3'-phosphoadenosine 5'-phosphosulfate sulfotransferase